ncbi:bifunctional ADP-dependent NAD(P)H-hydrate dehydratase/NAD(P)H-hydrate epimerase [Kocuria rhizophila]|uniref:bifunctional ADP-dependent NAD(P)H-hydrate dehydratase/NAD(P)H-hydrate epimerase n=1 Tax=Kocuria rhizophila TaxID=72000 RepID=UPI0007506754|nr:bifunctional ADP-dependent NAD(P)H-hydrate dehydratase/NAD(P)H-hydrate epimerase [Kocuria rhizophila]KUP27412.1 bifunctional ADP-dependent (S)-NAD(P)H-hydrate dehydratase/NAD(P)H-hydrate epimerase [Kocuria rhizophila]
MIDGFSGAAVRAAEQPLLDEGWGDELMRRAALGLARECEQQLRGHTRRGTLAGRRVVVLVGTGNNGGDGLWAGTFLRRRGVSVVAVLTGSRAHEAGLAAFTRAGGVVMRLVGDDPQGRAEPIGGTEAADPLRVTEAAALLHSVDLVLDAVLGTGASGGLRGPVADLVRAFEEQRDADARGERSGPRVVACDIVSGVSADTGETPEPVLGADATVTFGGAKTGHVVSPGEQAAGSLTVVPIGIEDQLGSAAVHRLEARDVLAAWPRPGATDTKYTRGVLGVVAGAPSYPGAAIMCTQAAVNAGAGMVRFLGDSTARAMVLARSPEVVCSDDQPWDVHVQAWLAGPGVVGDEAQAARVEAVIEAAEPAVLDAGALDAAARSVADARLGPHKILTPHAGELSQIFEWLHGLGLCESGVERTAIEANPLRWAREAARVTGATVLLKGATTVIASPVGATGSPEDSECLCLSVGGASPWLATAGSGDTLAGILGTVLAHVAEHPDALAGLGPWACGDGRWATAAALGAGLHALASRAHGEGPVPPSVLAESVRTVLTRP